MLSPICLFTYNRLDLTQQTVEALQRNYLAPLSDLFIFSDGAKNNKDLIKVNEVRSYIKIISGFKSVTIKESIVNKGLANSIINGITEIIVKYGKVIVLEDDQVSSPNFLNFINLALEFYKGDKRIQSINGYSLSLADKINDVYFQVRPFPWGWATWEDRWDKNIFNKEDLKTIIANNKIILKQFRKTCGNDISTMLINSINNKNDSWYVRWTFDHFRKNTYSVYPAFSHIQNIGHNEDGTHCKGINPYESRLIDINKVEYHFLNFQLPQKKSIDEFLKYFTKKHKLIVRIKLLPSKSGRKELIHDLKIKLGFK